MPQLKDGTKYIKDFCGNKDNIIKLTAESDGSYKAAEPVDINDNAAYDSPVDFTAPTLKYTQLSRRRPVAGCVPAGARGRHLPAAGRVLHRAQRPCR
jgi:hypothetical protein